MVVVAIHLKCYWNTSGMSSEIKNMALESVMDGVVVVICKVSTRGDFK